LYQKKKKEIVQHISKNTLSTLVDYIYGICSLGGSSTCVLDIWCALYNYKLKIPL